jgi:outer membrane murein-binding lipoprotein Lpp
MKHILFLSLFLVSGASSLFGSEERKAAPTSTSSQESEKRVKEAEEIAKAATEKAKAAEERANRADEQAHKDRLEASILGGSVVSGILVSGTGAHWLDQQVKNCVIQ